MARADGEAALRAALGVMRSVAVSRQLRITEKATFEHQARDLDADDVADLLAGVADEEVHDFKPDDRFPDRTAIVMRIRRDQLTLYVKVSVQVALFDVAVLSCHRWGM